MLEWIKENLTALGALGAAAAFIWPAIQFVLGRRQDRRIREFNTFHRLIKELAEPDEKSGATRVDRQIAIVFELRHFRRYFEVTRRILIGLREAWCQHQGQVERLVDEIDMTLSYIHKRKPNMALNPTVGRGRPPEG